nr:MAG TPA: Proteasome regulatory subunit C-terminal [Caudoviricetes sp.]DAR92071.1 MAG TPA: Proteasome regulatory subunit C-terminal [Caudoviricetes sp.]
MSEKTLAKIAFCVEIHTFSAQAWRGFDCDFS